MDSARVKCTVANVRVIGVRGCLPDKYRLNSDVFAGLTVREQEKILIERLAA